MSEPPRPVVAPVPASEARPLWSVMIPTFNCARELHAALRSVLEQDPGPDRMQIEVVDDCSTRDDPGAVVRELGAGRVHFHRQERNVGHTRNFNTCLERSRGELVHLLHGDDFVLPDFYRTMERPFAEHPEIGAAFCRYVAVDQDGVQLHTDAPLQPRSGFVDEWLEIIAAGPRLQPPAIVVRRQVYERLGGFDQRIMAYGEDWEMWVRMAASYPVWHQVEPLAAYRLHPDSLSRRAIGTGQNMRDLSTVIRLNEPLLPPARAARITRAAQQHGALAAIRRSHRMLSAGDVRTPLTQLREAIRLSPSLEIAARGTRLLGHWALTVARRVLHRGARA